MTRYFHRIAGGLPLTATRLGIPAFILLHPREGPKTGQKQCDLRGLGAERKPWSSGSRVRIHPDYRGGWWVRWSNHYCAGGIDPVWSPDGNWIAYEKDGDIWKVAVNLLGVKRGNPIRLTSGPEFDNNPTWCANSRTIAFQSDLDTDDDIWTIPAAGGTPTRLIGASGFGVYDPAYAKYNPSIGFSSFTPEFQVMSVWSKIAR